MKLSDERVLKRYEDVRHQCMRFANISEDGKETCHQALKFARDVDGLSFSMAGLLDDMALTIRQLEQQRDRYRGALKQLVELKEFKDKFGKTNIYTDRMPRAWREAKQALEKDDG